MNPWTHPLLRRPPGRRTLAQLSGRSGFGRTRQVKDLGQIQTRTPNSCFCQRCSELNRLGGGGGGNLPSKSYFSATLSRQQNASCLMVLGLPRHLHIELNLMAGHSSLMRKQASRGVGLGELLTRPGCHPLTTKPPGSKPPTREKLIMSSV